MNLGFFFSLHPIYTIPVCRYRHQILVGLLVLFTPSVLIIFFFLVLARRCLFTRACRLGFIKFLLLLLSQIMLTHSQLLSSWLCCRVSCRHCNSPRSVVDVFHHEVFVIICLMTLFLIFRASIFFYQHIYSSLWSKHSLFPLEWQFRNKKYIYMYILISVYCIIFTKFKIYDFIVILCNYHHNTLTNSYLVIHGALQGYIC